MSQSEAPTVLQMFSARFLNFVIHPSLLAALWLVVSCPNAPHRSLLPKTFNVQRLVLLTFDQRTQSFLSLQEGVSCRLKPRQHNAVKGKNDSCIQIQGYPHAYILQWAMAFNSQGLISFFSVHSLENTSRSIEWLQWYFWSYHMIFISFQ